MLTTHHLTCTIHHNRILTNIQIQIPKQGFTAIMGPNGAGKSTLLKVCAGHFPYPYEGQVLIQDKDIKKLSPREIARLLSLVPQDYHIPFEFSVEEVVSMGRYPYIHRLKGYSPKDKFIIAQTMDQMDLTSLAHRKGGRVFCSL